MCSAVTVAEAVCSARNKLSKIESFRRPKQAASASYDADEEEFGCGSRNLDIEGT